MTIIKNLSFQGVGLIKAYNRICGSISGNPGAPIKDWAVTLIGVF